MVSFLGVDWVTLSALVIPGFTTLPDLENIMDIFMFSANKTHKWKL